MTCDNNVTKGRELLVLVRNDADTEWELVGGARDRGTTFNNPTEETTSSSTSGDYGDSEFTGYSQATINLSGVIDKRSGITGDGGFTIVGASRLVNLATTGDRCGKFRILSIDDNFSFDAQGFFNITSFETSGGTPGLLSYTATLESKSDVTVTTT